MIDASLPYQESNWGHLASCTQLKQVVLRNGRYGDFSDHMGNDFSGLSCLGNLEVLEICPENRKPDRPPYAFDCQFSILEKLTKLSLLNVGFMDLPIPISGPVSKKEFRFHGFAGLRHLKNLDLTGNKLSSLPMTMKFSMHLEVLVLDSNAFIEIPDLTQFVSLTALCISDNPLKFYRDCDYLSCLPSLRILRLGNRRLLDVLPIFSVSQVDEICKDLRLCPVGGFHLGSLCSSLRYRNPACRLLM